jgi:small subunit ribosomal protein S1
MASNTQSKHRSANSGQAQSAMALLLAKHQNSFVTLKKGESVKAKLTKLNSNEILVDAGAKTEALVLEKDKRILRSILANFKVGDEVEVNVLNPESESGQPIVSLRRYLGNIAWNRLEELQKSKEQIEVTIADTAKAGYLVNTDFGITGFLPQSHAVTAHDLTNGSTLKVTVLELNRKDNKVIFSQKTALSEKDFTAAMKQFKVGDKVKVTVTNVTPFGLFVNIPLGNDQDKDVIEGFIHISEIAWEKVDDITGMFQTGQQMESIITRFDSEARRINLSIKRLTKDPFEALIEQFPVDKKVTGIVTKIDNSGVNILLTATVGEIEEEVEGYIKKEKVPPGTTYSVDQKVNLMVSEHDKKRHRIILVPVLLEKPLGYR